MANLPSSGQPSNSIATETRNTAKGYAQNQYISFFLDILILSSNFFSALSNKSFTIVAKYPVLALRVQFANTTNILYHHKYLPYKSPMNFN